MLDNIIRKDLEKMPNYELNMPRLTVTVTKEQAQWLSETSKVTGRKVSAIVRDGIRAIMPSETTPVNQ